VRRLARELTSKRGTLNYGWERRVFGRPPISHYPPNRSWCSLLRSVRPGGRRGQVIRDVKAVLTDGGKRPWFPSRAIDERGCCRLEKLLVVAQGQSLNAVQVPIPLPLLIVVREILHQSPNSVASSQPIRWPCDGAALDIDKCRGNRREVARLGLKHRFGSGAPYYFVQYGCPTTRARQRTTGWRRPRQHRAVGRPPQRWLPNCPRRHAPHAGSRHNQAD
jgi:hypothetical protein